MSKRLRDIDERTVPSNMSTRHANQNADDDTSVSPSKANTIRQENPRRGLQRDHHGFAFEEDLLASRVYCRPLFSGSRESLATSVMRTTASSILSALSLTDMSNISILAVPIYAHEISNSRRYTFGDINPSLPENEQTQAVKKINEALKANRWDRFAFAVWQQRQDKHSKTVPELRILGMPLRESIKRAFNGVIAKTENAQTYTHGYVPVFVASPITFLKKNG